MTSFVSCPSCGATLRPDASPGGLCPACLLSNALQDDLPADVTNEESGTLLMPGVMLGTFRIGALLGRGGMATVYEAYDAPLDRAVALKILPPQFLHDRSFAKRFEQEARVVARLEHPAIVPIYASGTDEGIPWMSMRLLGGGNMGTLLKQARPDRVRSVEILKQVAEALDYAHAHGVVHRDIKPTNILFDGSNRPCVGDFGLAHMLEGNPVVTRTGVVVGTPHYMAPEQALGKGVDHRCDVYSLGIVAYEMFVGAPPFTGDSPVAVLLKHVNEPLPVPPAGRLSEPMLKAIHKAVAKDPSERWPSAGAFTDALAAALAEQHSERRPVWQRRSVWLALAGAALLGTAALAWEVMPMGGSPPPNIEPPSRSGNQPDSRFATRRFDSGAGTEAARRQPLEPNPPADERTTARDSSVGQIPGVVPPVPSQPVSVEPLAPPADDSRTAKEVEKPPEPQAPTTVQTPAPAADVIVLPRLIRRVAAAYPDVARAARLEGNVVLDVAVRPDGTVANVRVLKPRHAVLDDAARKAVLQYTYSPGRRNNVPEAMSLQETVVFKMTD